MAMLFVLFAERGVIAATFINFNKMKGTPVRMQLKSIAPALTALVFAASVSAAGLDGDSVYTAYVGVGSTTVGPLIVGPGEEGNFFTNQFFNYGDFSFSIRSTASFCGIYSCSAEPISLQLTDLDFGSPLTGVSFTSLLSGVSVVFGANFANFSWSEQTLPADTYLTARFSTESAPVPEPGSLALLGLAMVGGLAASRRSKR